VHFISAYLGAHCSAADTRKVPLNLEAAKAIQDWLEVLGTHRPDAPLFESQRKGKAIDRTQAYRILEGA
jgi:site-specific recombinase XerC